MSKPFRRQVVSEQLYWDQLGHNKVCLRTEIIEEDGQRKDTGYFEIAQLGMNASGAYEFTWITGSFRCSLKTRLRDCSFETLEEGKKALQEIISTMDLSSLIR